MASVRKLLLLSAFVASTVAVPVSQSGQCARYCTDESDFALRPGSTYTYDYETTTVTTVQGSSQDKTQLQMTAQADIEVISKCELSLRLRGVTLKLSDPESPEYLVSLRGAREFARTIERHTLRFSYQNGQVEHVCPSENVPSWVTNIQKGVLSAFQTYKVKPEWTTRTLETDILGKCTAEYHSLGRSWQGAHTIRKLKDLASCTERENIETYLQGTPYTPEFDTKSLPAVKGNQECEQVISENFLQTSTCNEKLMFRPFSSRSNGVVTTVSQKLIFAALGERKFTGNDYRPTTELLLFSHAKEDVSSAKIEEETEVALKELCEASKDDISITVPRKFSTFVYKLKKLPLRSMKALYQKTETLCPGNPKSRKFFMDAIPLVGTSDAAHFMYEMITRKTISDSEISFWLTSLSFITDTTPEVIATFTPLLEGRFDQAILGISALIRNYCNGKDCYNVPEVQAAVNKLTENLGENCFSPEDKTIILSLKAIGNIGYMFGKENLLEACYKNPQIRTEARLAAIDAFRRVTCDVSRGELLKTYMNYNEDTEIRIAAYLALVKCPDFATIQAVKDVMMKETINHVGSFVWTHLNALSKSRHPERQEIKEILSNLYLMNKFASDARKFSTAREATFFLESIDSGIHVDNHIIFSTDSYLPKSAMFNLTVDVFGKTCNLFQIDGRMEGLERVAESFFGPNGYFPQKNVAKLLRDRRSLDNNKLTTIDNQFKTHLRNQEQPYGSLDIKVFGTSMWYDQFRASEDGTPEINLMDFVTKLAEEKDREYSRSFTFLDSTFTIPMTSGLPLKIALNGTASVGLKIGGKFDVKSFEHVDVFGHIEPSGAIEIASLLTVDAGNVARSGMRVVSTMHSSSVLDGKVQVRNGEIIKMQLNMPKDRIDVFNIQSKLYLVHGLEEKEKISDKKAGTHLESCTGKTTTRLLGVKFCSELELPPYRANSPLHPLNGPARLNLFIEKTDPSLKSYNFDAQWLNEKKNGGVAKYGVLSFNTPDSKVDRDVKVELQLNQNDHTATLKVKTPVKRVGANAKLVNSDSQKKLDFSVTLDEKDYFSFQSELGIKSDKSSAVYTPSLEIKLPNRRLVALTGSADLRYNQKYTAQLKVEDLTEKPILAKVNMEMGKRDRYDIEMSLNSFPLDGTVKGYAQLGDSMSSRLTADYRILEGKMNKLNIIGKVRNQSANALTKYSGILNIQASVLPEWNTELQFETMKTTGHIENTVSLSLGDGARSRVHTIKLQEILRYEGNPLNNKVDVSISLAYPEKNIDYSLKMNHENTDHSLKNQLQIQYDTRKQVSTEAQLKMAAGNTLSVSGDIKVKYPGRDVGLQAEVSQTGQEYRGAVTCQWQQGRQAGAVFRYNDRSDGSRMKHEVEGSLNLPSSNPITFSSTAGYHRGQLAASADLNMRGNKYRAKVDVTAGNGFNHRMSGQLNLKNDVYGLDASTSYVKDRFNGNMELKMPNRHRATAKLECKMGESMKFGSFETYWDADRDTSKKFTVGGELRSQNEGYDAQVSMQILRRTVKGALSTSLQGNLFSSQWKTNNKLDLEWSATEKVSGILSMNVLFDRARQQVNNHFEITTPYYGFENVSVSLTHLFTNQQWSSELSTLLPKGNDISLSSSGKYSFVRGNSLVETTAKAETSFSGFEELLITVAHRHNAGELSNKAEMKWGMDKRIIYQLTGSKQASTLKGSVKVSTPFAYARDLSGEINYSHLGNTYRTTGAVQWSPSKRLGFVAEGNHELNGRRRICTVSLEGSSPYRGYENTAMKVTYSNDGITVSTDSEMSWSRNKITTSMSVSRRNQMYNKNIEGKFLFTSPFRNYEAVQLSSSLEMNQNSYKINVDTQMPYRSTVSFNSQGKIISLSDIEVNAIVIGNVPKYMKSSQRVSLDFVHKYQNSKLRSSLDTSYGDDRLTVLLTGSMESGYSSRNVEVSVAVNTPFQGFEELKTEFTHNQRGYEYFSKLQANKNTQSVSLTHKLNIRDKMNFETTLELTSTSNLPSGKLSIIQASNGRQLEHNSYVVWDKTKKIHFNAQYLDKTFLKEALIKITTPFRSFRDMELKSSIECQDREHKGILSLVWDRRNKMTLSGDLKNYQWQSMNAQVEFTSPFRGYEFYSTAVKYDMTGPQKEGEISFLWDVNNRKSITAKGSFLNSRRLTQLDASLTTPFEDFESLSLSTKYENISPVNALVVSYERGSQKITFEGRTTVRSNSAEVSVELSTPFRSLRELSSSMKYSSSRNGMKGEVATEWNRVNKYKATALYELDSSSAKGNVEVMTSLRGYEKVTMDINGSYENSKLTSEATLRWDNNKKISVNADFYNNRGNGELNLKIRSPFDNYSEMSLSSKYKVKSGIYEGEIKTTMNDESLFQGSSSAKYGGAHLAEIQVNFNTPVRPFQDVQMILSIDSNPEKHQLLSTLKWQDKEADIHLLLNKNSGVFYEAKMKLNTPFEGFKALSFDSSLRNDRGQFLDGRLTIVTPFEFLRSFDAYGEYKNDDSGNFIDLKVETPQKKVNINGKLVNNQFRPLIASLNIEAPFMSFRKLSSDLELTIIEWNNAKAKFQTNSALFSHEIELKLLQDSTKMGFEAKAKSTALRSRKAIITVTTKYDDPQRVTVEASAELLGSVHYLNGQYKYNGRNLDTQLEVESPLLPEGKSGVIVKFNRRRNDKILDGEINFFVPSSNHQISAKYENKGNQISANVKVDSGLLSSSTLESQVKYINSNNRDIEAAFSISTPVSSHSITGSLKNYDGEKMAQLKIECPAVSYLNPLTITSTLKHNGYKAMDGMLSITTPRNEVRIAGNLKNEGSQNVEAFLTINTPFEALKMVRLDGRFRNDQFQNIDCNFQLETSNPSLPSLGATSKLSRTEGSDEMSLMLRLPLRNYRSVQLLGNVHYNLDYSSADSRITISLPRNKYVVYGQYGIGRSRVSGRSEVEIDNQKWSVTGRLERNSEKKDLSVSLMTPSSQTYTVGGAYGKSGSQHHLAATYNSPSNDRYSWNSTMSYENIGNFAVDFQVDTPFRHYRNVQGSVQQQSSSTHLSTNVEYTKDGRRGFLKVSHRVQRDGLKGTVQMGCPYSKLRDVKLSYSRVKKYTNTEDSVELDYNRSKQLKMEVILFGEKSAHVVLDIPALPLTVTADSKQLANGREINFRSNYFSRVVSFRTSHQLEARQILHAAAFSWDERAEKRISYDFKLSKTETGQELWTRLDTPLRSFMLKGNSTLTSRTQSGGIDFYWDASRSLEKHVAVGLVYADISTDKQTSHRVQLIMEHPKLATDIIQTNVITYSPSEFTLKSDLHYSRERQHNLVLEVKANDLSRSVRSTHYKSELTLSHPATKMDIRAVAEVMDSKLESSAHIRLDSVDRTQMNNIRVLKLKIMKLRQEINLSMRSNGNEVGLSGQVSGRNGEYDINLQGEMDQQQFLNARAQYSRRNRAVDASIAIAEKSRLQVSVACPKDSVSLKISHSDQEHLVSDVNLYLGLEQTKVLKSKLNWRPKLWEDLRINTGETLRYLIRSTKAGYTSLASSFSEELSYRVTLMSRTMTDLLSPFVDDMKNGMVEIQRDISHANDAFWRMYYRNEFYMRDIVADIEIVKKVAKDVAIGISLGCEVLYNITMEQLENICDTIYYSCLDLADYLDRVYSHLLWKTNKAMKCAREALKRGAAMLAEKMNDFMERSYMKFEMWSERMILKFDKWVRSYAPCIIDGYYYVKHTADRIRYSINGMTTTVSDCIMSNPYYIALRNYADSVMSTIRAFRDYEYTLTAQAFLNRVYDMQLMDNILNHPTVDYMSNMANSALRKSVEVYHNLGLDVVAANLAETGSNYIKTMALNSAQEYLEEFYQTKAGAKYDFAPQRGVISLEFSLPASRNSLVEVFDFKSYPEYQKMMSASQLATEYYKDFCIWDYYYKVLKYFTPNYWLPAFSAHALISGNQHFITFDKLSYDFAGKCSYLLARDFVDGNFTAIVNYGTEDHMRRSLTVLVDGRKVDIGNDYKITLDDTKTELPIQIKNTVVIREGSNVRVENEKKGFSVVCNFVHNYCSVSVSGFYFGKTAGLFGTFNYEPSLDMMTPARYVMGDIESFVGSWEVGQGVCQSENFATLPSNDYRVQRKCKALFEESTSQYRPCFKQVDPETYLNMCIRDLAAVHENDHNDAICESAAAYFIECKAEGVAVKMPKHCVRCEKQDGSYMVEGDAIQFPRDGKVTAADVVFLVEEKACNKESVKYLSKLAQSIEDNYRQKGYRDVRYSVVGFGGDEVHSDPHIHTLDGRESGPLRSLDSALQSLEYGNGPVNILEAIRFAASLTYRPGTTKSFILMKCSTCKSEELKAEYSEMLRTLLDGDITLHLLMEQKFEMKIANKNSKARRVIGVDKKFAYTLKDVKDTRLSGDGDLLAQLKIPKDVCIPLAFEVNGTSFDSQFLTETKKNTNKKFIDVLSRLVVRTSDMSTPDWGMCCECLATEDGVGKSACQRCVSAEVASMISADSIELISPIANEDSRNAPKSRPRKSKDRRSGL